MTIAATVKKRFECTNQSLVEDRLVLRDGRLGDYKALAEHHYRAARPATVTRVLALTDRRSTVIGRYVRCGADERVVGVVVESLPALNCRMRDWALRRRYGSIRDMRHRARLINEELRCISRVVVHPQWRGLGLAVRLVRAALASASTPLTEALAAMGKVHPFFERAGMTAYHRPPHSFDARLVAALQAAGFEPIDLAQLDRLNQRIFALPDAQRRWLHLELQRWYRRTFGRASDHCREPIEQLRAAQQRLLCEPVYYLHDNRAE